MSVWSVTEGFTMRTQAGGKSVNGWFCRSGSGDCVRRRSWSPMADLVVMFRHLFQLVLGPCRHGMNVAVFVAHEIKLTRRYRNRLGADAKKAAYVNDHPRGRAGPVNMGNRSHLGVIRTIDRRVIEDGFVQFLAGEAYVLAVIHRIVSS